MKKIIALFIVLLSVFTYVTVNSFSLYITMPENGYIVEDDNILEKLTEEKKLSFISVSQDDEIYERNGKLYLNRTSVTFNESYPMILNNREVVCFFDESAVLLGNDFYQETTYKNMYLSNGLTFNGDYTQADSDEYILVRLYDGSYLNAQLIKIEKDGRTVYIENSSFISFTEDKIVYETLQDDGTVYLDTIGGLLTATISIGQNKYNYNEFYEYLKMSEEDSSFTIDKEDFEIDNSMPSVKAKETGGAQLKNNSEKKTVEIDAETVIITEIVKGEEGKESVSAGDESSSASKKEEKKDLKETDDEGESQSGESSSTGEADKTVTDGELEITLPEDGVKTATEESGQETDEENPTEASNVIVVKVNDFDAWVYTAGTSAIIYDGGSRIIGNVKFIVKDVDGNTVSRKSAGASGDILLSNLPPDSQLTITANYRYKDLDGLKYETGKNGIDDVFKQTIHTLPLSQVPAVKVDFKQSNETYSNQMSVTGLTLSNPTAVSSDISAFEKSKVNIINYVTRMQFEFTRKSDGELFVDTLSNSMLNKLKNGEELDYITSKVLESKSSYDYELVLYDRFGNRIKTSPSDLSGEVLTEKITPSISFKVVNNEAGSITIRHTLSDVDNAISTDPDTGSTYRYRIKNQEGLYTSMRCVYGDDNTVQSSDTLVFDDDEMTLTFTNLPYSNYLTIEVFADVDVNDGKGLQEDTLVGSYSFYSAGIVSGQLTYITSFKDIGGTFATVSFRIASGSNSRLASLMSDFKVTFTSQDGEDVRVFNVDKEVLEAMSASDGTLNFEEDGCIIQEANEKTGAPEIKMMGSEMAFNENVWQAFVNGASNPSDIGTLQFTFPSYSLSPSTTYYVTVESLIDQGLSFYNINTVNKNNQFTTLKREPNVYNAIDVEVINNTATFTNIYIEDIDGTIVTDSSGSASDYPVTVELVYNDIIFDSQPMNTGIDNAISFTFSNLMDNQQYEVRFKAKEYNNGSSELTLKNNYVFYTTKFKSNSNINGNLDVGELERQPVQIYSGNKEKYAQKNLLSEEFNLVGSEEAKSEFIEGYYMQYNGVLIKSDNYFATGYIAINKDLPYTFLIRNFSTPTYYGNYKNGTSSSYYSNWNYYMTYYEYNEAKDKYTVLGWSYIKYRGDYIDFSTLSYASRITHVTFSGMVGYEDKCEVYQGIEVLDIVDNSDYGDEYREIETELNNYGEYVTNTSYTTISYYDYEVHPGDIYYSNCFCSSHLYKIAFYDENYNIIYTTNYYAAERYMGYKVNQGNLIIVPNNAKYMKATFHNNNVNNETYYLKHLSTSEEVYHTTLDVTIEDRNSVFTEPTKYRLKSYIGTDIYEPSNHDALVEYKPDEVVEFFSDDDEFTIWEYENIIDIDVNTYYYFELYLIIEGRDEILLDTAEIYTDSDWSFIYSWEDFAKIAIDPYGQYKVMADIVMPSANNYNGFSIQGTLDFNGHTFTPANCYWGFGVGKDGVLENMVVEYDYPEINGIVNYGDVIDYNYGTIRNCIFRFDKELTLNLTSTFAPIGHNMQGATVENCCVVIADNLVVQTANTGWPYCSTFIYENRGTVRNCYVTTPNESVIYVQNANNVSDKGIVRFAEFVMWNEGGHIENCYTAVNVYQRQGTTLSQYCSNFVMWHRYGGVIENCFAVGDRYEFNYVEGFFIPTGIKTTEQPPCLYSRDSSIVNSYYFHTLTANYTYNDKYGFISCDSQNLQNTDWYTGTLGFVESNDEYSIKDPVSINYYPRLTFPSFMAAYQPFVAISEYSNENSELRVTDAQVTSQYDNYAYGTIYIYNPQQYLINEVKLENLECNIENISYDLETSTTEVYIRVSSPGKYLSSYSINYISYNRDKLILSLTSTVKIPFEFYRSISTVSDWAAYVVKDPTQNYRLTADINFNGASESSIYVDKTFTGKIDGAVYDNKGNKTGDRYSLKNISLGENRRYVFRLMSTGAEIRNLIIDNMNINPGIKATDRVGFINYCESSRTVIDNVTVTDSSVRGSNDMAMLVARARYLTITNSSCVNCTMEDYLPSGTYSGTVYMGAIIGYSDYCIISNCFVYGFDGTVSEVKSIGGVGAMFGYCYRTNISNVYTDGSISNYSSNTGGLIGCVNWSIVENGFTHVTLEGADIIGGITGKDNDNNATNKTSSTSYTNLFAMGDIYIKNEQYTDVHRLFGTHNKFGTNVYAYASQKVSPEFDDDQDNKDDTTRLIQNSELIQASMYRYEVGLGDSFDYSETASAILPKLYSTELDEDGNPVLLPSQENIYVSINGVSVSVQIAQKDSTYTDKDVYHAQIVVSHPKGYTIKSKTVDLADMETLPGTEGLSITHSSPVWSPEEGVYIVSTVIDIHSTILKALDQYTLTFTLQSEGTDSGYSQQMTAAVIYKDPIYWEIPNFSKWQEIMKNHGYTNENFKITGEIDFSKDGNGITYKNLMANKILGTNDAVIKNISTNGTSTSGLYSLFANITSGIYNVKFENIKINMKNATGGVTNYGLICQTGTVENITVDGFSLTFHNKSYMYNIGFIGRVFGNITNFNGNDINIYCENLGKGHVYYVGTFGYISGGMLNCNFDDINITCPRSGYNHYIGGAIGYSSASYIDFLAVDKNDTENYSLKITNSYVQGYEDVGGAFGGGVSSSIENLYRTFNGVYVDHCEVDGCVGVGGCVGYRYPAQYNLTVSNTTVNSDMQGGGYAGYSDAMTMYNMVLENVDVTGIYETGIFCGSCSYPTIYNLKMLSCTATGFKCVGGIAGCMTNYYPNAYYVYAEDCDITGVEKDTSTYDAYRVYYLTRDGFEADGSCVGFVIGKHAYYYNYYDCIFGYYILNDIDINGTYNVGGFIGEGKASRIYYGGSDMDVSGEYNVGGIIGKNIEAYNSYLHKFMDMYVQGTVTGDNYVGGVVGFTEYYPPEDTTNYHWGLAGYVYNAENNREYNYSYSVILNESITCDSENCDYFGCSYYEDPDDPTLTENDPITAYCGNIYGLYYMDTCEMSKGGSSYEKISEDTLPVLYNWQDKTTEYFRQPEILTVDDLTNFSRMYLGRRYGNVGLESYGMKYTTDNIVTEYPFEVTKSASDTIEITGLGKNTNYEVELQFIDKNTNDEDLLLYYDAKNNTGEGEMDTTTTVWKNLGSLGSDYDMTIYTTASDPSTRYSWTDNGLKIKARSYGSDGLTTSIYSDTYLTTDEEKGRMKLSESGGYTISVTLRNDYKYGNWIDLFGTWIDPGRYSTTDWNGSTIYKYQNCWGYMLRNYHENTNRVYIQAGDMGYTYWTGDGYVEGLANGAGRFTTYTMTVEYEENNGLETYYLFKYYVDGKLYATSRGRKYEFGSANYHMDVNDTTDGWIHMLVRPRVTETNGEKTYSYSNRSAFGGTIYSARLYGHALNEQEVSGIYSDDYTYYKGSGASKSTTVSAGTLKSDSNGNLTITGLKDLGIPSSTGMLKVSLNGNVNQLSYVNINDQVMGLTVKDAESKNTLSGYYFENKKLILDSGVVISDLTDNTVEWYRSTTNSYHGELVAEGEETLYVNMNGYYYALINGQYTSIIHLKNNLHYPLIRSYQGTDGIEYSEGRDPDGNWISTTDKLINGGIEVKGFTHTSSNTQTLTLNTKRNVISENLPMLYVYGSDVDKLTIELDENIDEAISISVISEDGMEVLSASMYSRSLSFYYDFATSFAIEWSNGTDTSVMYYDAVDLRNTVSTYGEHYYYLTNNTIETDTTSYELTGANIYENRALLADLRVLDLDEGTYSEAGGLFKICEKEAAFHFEKDENTIDSYYSYTVVNDDIDNAVEGEVILKYDESYILSPAVSDLARGVLVDEYNSKLFLTVVKDGMMIDLYDSIKYPEEFVNRDIVEISNTVNAKGHIVLVRYSNGTIAGFNYLIGKELELISTSNQNFLQYLGGQLSSLFASPSTTGLQGAYKEVMGQASVLESSNDKDVLTLFAGLSSDNAKGEGTGNGTGNNRNELIDQAADAGEGDSDSLQSASKRKPTEEVIADLLTKASIHGTDITISYKEDEGRFIIRETVETESADCQYTVETIADSSEEAKEGKGESGESIVIEKTLQEQIDELAEKETVPGLNKGIIRTTHKTYRKNNLINVAFGSIIAAILMVAIIFVYRKSRSRI